ncbi:hypothetical protein GGF31_001265 [Allomyces arbusculus]|nr:hypothetical protein GGF31_001265 [Allomyces arbusculus]
MNGSALATAAVPMPASMPISAPMPAAGGPVPVPSAMPRAPMGHDAGFTINIQLRYLPTTRTGEHARIEMHDPMVTVATDPPGTSISVSQALVRTDVAWPSFVQVLLQQLVQLPMSVEQSVRMAGGMYLHVAPPLHTPVAPSMPQSQPASALNALGALATNPIMQSLAQTNPVLAQLMLAQSQRESHALPKPGGPSRWKASFNDRIESFFEHTGARARFEPTGLGTGIVRLEFDPAALDVETVVRRTLARSWTVFGGRPLIIEPLDPKWRGILRETPKPEIYVAINTPGRHEAPLKDVTRHFDVDKVWPYLDRAPAYIPGTTLSYTFMTVENPPRPNLLMDRDGIMVFGHKVRVKRVEDPVSFFRTPYQLHDMCMQMARADPELSKLVEHAVRSGHFGNGGPGPRGRSS